MKLETVGDLIEKLQGYDPDLPWGVAGHFGELHPMDVRNVYLSETFVIDPETWRRGEKQEVIAAVLFDHIDIGEEPS